MDIETSVKNETNYVDKEQDVTDEGNSTGVDEGNSTGVDESNDSRSSSGKEIKRGKKRKHSETAPLPQRETPKRAAARKAKRYIDEVEDFYESDEAKKSDDPDYDLSDSCEDPDFEPSKRKTQTISPKFDFEGRRSHGNRSQMQQGQFFRQSFRSTGDSDSAIRAAEVNEYLNNLLSQNRRRNQSSFERQSEEISDNTVSSTDDTQKLYNFTTTQSRQNQAIKLPEGPNLTEEQLKLIESQFKSGDFVMAKKDKDIMENPPIWKIDGSSLLQKFQSFEKNGKTLYRNISTYSGWTAQAKALYIPVKVKSVFQSRTETVVELIGFKGLTGDDESLQIIDKPECLPKKKDFEISDELKKLMPTFEVYLQTLISQSLDSNFLQEIFLENDAYFVDRIKEIDESTDLKKEKILNLSKWNTKFQESLDTWPCVNTMIIKNTGKCKACYTEDATVIFQLYGEPYDQKTLQFEEPANLYQKDFEICESCSNLSQLYNKVVHQKYDFYNQCKYAVTNMRVTYPGKSTTNVLKDLLANDDWINGMFRSMCTTWIRIDNLYDERSSASSSKTTVCASDSAINEDVVDPDDPSAVNDDAIIVTE